MNLSGLVLENLNNSGITTIIHLQENNNTLIFKNDTLSLRLPFYRKDGVDFNFTNSVFLGPSKKIKILLTVYFLYKWLDVDFPPRFNFNIMLNNQVYISRNLGISDELDTNEFNLNIILDLKHNDILTFLLITDFEQNKSIQILNNSYYILKTF